MMGLLPLGRRPKAVRQSLIGGGRGISDSVLQKLLSGGTGYAKVGLAGNDNAMPAIYCERLDTRKKVQQNVGWMIYYI